MVPLARGNDSIEGAGADATEEAFCVNELAETRAKKDDKIVGMEKLNTQIDQMSTRSAQLHEEVTSLQKALADSINAHAEMDKLRS